MLAATSPGDRLSVDVQGLQALRAQARANDPESLREAARQFEALLVQTLLKSLRDASLTTEDDPFAESGGLRMYRDLLDQQWSQKISAGQGLGFAEAMVRQMRRNTAPAAPGDDPAAAVAPLAAPARRQPAASPAAAMPAPAPPPAAAAPAAVVPVAGDHKQAFVLRLRAHAEEAARLTGVPVHFILGHAALESGWGAREISTAEGAASHNLFGIKAGPGWSGGVAEVLTTEYQNGLAVKRSERFRAYADYTEAFADYARLLKERYGSALAAADDARSFARAVADGGYATDPNYGDKLGRVIASVTRAGV